MERLQIVSLIIGLLKGLKKKDSWCGETHLQKSIYFLQELAGVPMGFDFILYKHGPFSFDLRDELTAMRADRLIEHVFRPAPYGPSLGPTKSGSNVYNHFPVTVKKYSGELEFVADRLGNKGVGELERMGTALYVMLENPDANIQTNADYIHKLKPHVSVQDARLALRAVERMKKELHSYS